MNWILASGSPRRRELLEMLGVPDLTIRPAGKCCGGAVSYENRLPGNRRNESRRLFLRSGNLLFLP